MNKPRYAAPLAVALVAAVMFGIWWFSTRHTATTDVVEGWASPDPHGTVIALFDSDDTREGNSYIIAGASWAGLDHSWHEGDLGPTCVGTDPTSKTRVRLGIVDVETDGEGVGGPRVMWLRCLT